MNGNGDVFDEILFGVGNFDLIFLYIFLFNNCLGVDNIYEMFVKDGKLVYFCIEESYK